MSGRRAQLAAGVAIVLAAAVVVAVLLLSDSDDDRPPAATGPDVTTDTETTPAPPGAEPEALERVPGWGDFAGAPPDLETPPGGDAAARPASGGATEVTLRREDGSVLARARVDAAGDPLDARFFDERGALTLVVTAARARPGPRRAAGTAAALRVRCGSARRVNAGWRFRSFPVRWRLNARSVPRGERGGTGLRALRRARSTWMRNRSHCRRIADRSALRFAYQGTTTRPVGRNGISSVGFGRASRLGGVCARAVACTLTWIEAGGRAVESDTRFDSRIGGGWSTRGARAAFDIESVMVHELGHSLGFGHVSSNDNVMYPYARRGDRSARRLGRGDALINNARY